MFVTPELREKTADATLDYYAPKRVDNLVNIIITVVIFVLLILPVVAMYELSDVSQRASPFEAIGILIVFTLLFGTAMSSLTKATRQELFAASAAYCAVLVVFISNFSTQTVEIAK
jgi:FtsH-binding integral membrane protein